jgi:nucleotide-binding universal stress UspA family protein
MRFRRILCAVDFSTDSLEGFRVTVEMARLHSAAIHVFHVIETLPVAPAEAEIRLLEKAHTAMEALVASQRESLDGLMFTADVSTGSAFAEIVNRAREWQADLIVLGAKGVSTLEELVIGGTAEHVVKEAPCSVFVVRPGEELENSSASEDE